jgi:hypothetical protein
LHDVFLPVELKEEEQLMWWFVGGEEIGRKYYKEKQ